jgi:hypothetical protein
MNGEQRPANTVRDADPCGHERSCRLDLIGCMKYPSTMARTFATAWARRCIMTIMMAVLVAASGVGAFAHVAAACAHQSATDHAVPVAAHDHDNDHHHGHGHSAAHHDTDADTQSSDGDEASHADCCGHFCQPIGSMAAPVFATPMFVAGRFPVMGHRLGPDAPCRNMERPPSRTAEI